VRSGWLAGAWSRDGLWPAGDSGADSLRRHLARETERSLRAVLAVDAGVSP
jgi:hypothetical protein